MTAMWAMPGLVIFFIIGSVLFVRAIRRMSYDGIQGTRQTELLKQKGRNAFPHYKIAVLVPIFDNGIETLVEGFEETLRREGTFNFSIRIYDPRGERTALRSYAEDIFDGSYDLIYSIGMEPIKMLREISLRRGKNIPIVFSEVTDPVGLGIVASEEHSGNNITGVKAYFNFALEIRLLVTIKEGIQRALIIYDSSMLGGHGMQWKEEVKELLESQKIKVKAIEIFNVDEIETKVTPYIDVTDVVLILRDKTALAGLDRIGKLCSQHGVTLMVADLSGPKKGAALSFGFRDYDTGVVAAYKAYEILEKKKRPSDIPITDVGEHYKLLINEDVLEQQNLSIDSKKLLLMRYARVIGGNDDYMSSGEKSFKR